MPAGGAITHGEMQPPCGTAHEFCRRDVGDPLGRALTDWAAPTLTAAATHACWP
jgi:hypothetical protein